MRELGKIEKISDIRSVWSHEARDFSRWLAQPENLEELSKAIGVEISLDELESRVGDFSVDLFATEEGTGRRIIIENQLEETNHDHLGKIITYAAGKDAEVIIWIVKRARDEHRQAVEWLNLHTDENIGVFLIEIEVWKIGDSLPAPVFKVVEQPNNWTKAVRNSGELSETGRERAAFWQRFVEIAEQDKNFMREFRMAKSRDRGYLDIFYGNAKHHVCLLFRSQKRIYGVELYATKQRGEVYDRLSAHEEEMEGYEWTDNAKSYVFKKEMPMTSSDDWDQYIAWMIEEALQLKAFAQKYAP